MSDGPITIHETVELRDPFFIAAFGGWNDAGESATHAARHLTQVWGAQRIASIDPEEFYDFQAVRPEVRLRGGITREIQWPANEFWAAKLQGADRDALIMIGVEPSHRWKTFSKLVAGVAASHQVSLVITLGALLADVPHSRDVPITGTAGSEELVEELNLKRSQYEGPTGIVGVLHDAVASEGMKSASLWAAVPHYLAVTPNPKAALALIERTVQLTQVGADISTLQHASHAYEERVAEIVATDEDVQQYVSLLEERADEELREEMVDISELPSADELAAELERFLRDHDK